MVTRRSVATGSRDLAQVSSWHFSEVAPLAFRGGLGSKADSVYEFTP
jgi:hypothetical protein